MFSQNSLFFQSSKKVAEEFLQTTVIVDDQAYFPTQEQSKQTIKSVPVLKLREPGRGHGKPSGKSKVTEVSLSVDKLEDEIGSHVLDAQKIINSFADKQIVCSVIRPSSDTNWISSVEKLASSTDILILDWEIKQDNGKKTKNLLGELLAYAQQAPEQLRLLVVYTGDPKISEIAEKIKAEIQKRLRIDPEQILEQDDGFSFIVSSTRIVIFSKPGTNYLPDEYKHRKVDFDDLADRVISEFAVMTAGLVSNVAITSLALIRKNTRKILSKFSAALDAPYLTHRVLQAIPADAEEFLTELIGEELRAILDEESVGKGASLEMIEQWLLAANKGSFTLALEPEVLFSLEETLDILKAGLGECKKISGKKKEHPHRLPLTAMFKPSTIIDQNLDERFSVITTIRTPYEKKKPRLTFGTILQRLKDNSYWICLQPKCDAVRIKSERAFPLLPLQLSNQDNKFSLVLQDSNRHVRLSLNDKPYNLNLVTFLSKTSDQGNVAAKFIKGNYFFTSTGKVKYKWIGELRPEHAQRIANEFAANLSRVGLDESEWLRLWATKG